MHAVENLLRAISAAATLAMLADGGYLLLAFARL
jgi:hypothetical protein